MSSFFYVDAIITIKKMNSCILYPRRVKDLNLEKHHFELDK